MNGVIAALAATVVLGVTPPARTLVAGPVLAGNRVVWGELRGSSNILVGGGEGAALWQSDKAWLAGPLAASPSTIAFAASANGCSGPNTACPVETTVFARSGGNGWIPITAPMRCTSPTAGRTVAVSGSLVALAAPSCGSAASVVTVREGRREVFRRTEVDCCDVALAGRMLAWRSDGAVSVFDLATHRLRFRLRPPAGETIAAFDVQADGKLALLIDRQPDGHATVAWRTATQPTLHRLRLRAVVATRSPSLRLIGNKLVLETAPPASPSDSIRSSALVVSNLNGRARVLARFSGRLEQVGGFDATLNALTWASHRVTRTRLDCPPPGQERPCLLRKTGVLTIWAAPLNSGRARAVASWSFTDAP